MCVYLDSFFQMKNTSIRIRPPEVIESTVCLQELTVYSLRTNASH